MWNSIYRINVFVFPKSWIRFSHSPGCCAGFFRATLDGSHVQDGELGNVFFGVNLHFGGILDR